MNTWINLFDYLQQASTTVSYSTGDMGADGGNAPKRDPRSLPGGLGFQRGDRPRDDAPSLSLIDLLEQPALRAMLPPVAGLDILELGRGARQFADYCQAAGARHVVGVDLARGSDSRREKADPLRESLDTVERLGESYDLVVSSLAVDYIEDFQALAQRVRARLKRGGVFVYSAEHPIATAPRHKRGWIQQEQGQKLFWPVDDYAAEGERREQWDCDDVPKYHRRLSTQLNALIRCGFLIEQVEEPCPEENEIAERPHLADEYRRPPFLMVRARRA